MTRPNMQDGYFENIVVNTAEQSRETVRELIEFKKVKS